MIFYFLCFVCLCQIKNVFSQCDNDTNYIDTNELIESEKGDIFDKLLYEYGDIVEELEKLLDTLSETTERADQNLTDFEISNQKLKEFNDNLDSQLEAMFKELQDLEGHVHNLNASKLDPDLFNKNITIPPTTLEHLNEMDNKLSNWQEFADKNNKKILADDIMNIPYGVSDDITFLETALVDKKHDTKCLDKFHEDLKSLFEDLSTLLNFKEIADEIKHIENISSSNREIVKEIYNDTMAILESEKKLLETYGIANDTLKLANDINALKEEIDELRQRDSNYGKLNLNNLNKLLKQLKRYETLELDIEQVEEEIERYVADTDCYLGYIGTCHIRKASDDLTPPDCVKC